MADPLRADHQRAGHLAVYQPEFSLFERDRDRPVGLAARCEDSGHHPALEVLRPFPPVVRRRPLPHVVMDRPQLVLSQDEIDHAHGSGAIRHVYSRSSVNPGS